MEDNEILRAIDENADADMGAEERKHLLTQGFCSLDMNLEDYSAEDVQHILDEDWQIKTKNDLMNTLDFLLKQGDSGQIENMLAFQKKNPSPSSQTIESFRAFSNSPYAFQGKTIEQFHATLEAIKNYETKLPKGGLRGWDVARYVHLIRLGFVAKMLKAGEGWLLLMKIKESATKTFSSWKDFARSYQAGRLFWSGTQGTLDDACERLLSHPQSPWKVFEWL
mgnify:CR=1 FL=1